MNEPSFDFPSRISARAVSSGLATSYALTFLFITLSGGLGFWEFRLFGLPKLFSGFWFWSSLTWVAACYCGALVAAFSGRCRSILDGALVGLVTWSAACTIAYGIVFFALRLAFVSELSEAKPSGLFSIFLGNLIALVSSVVGGWHGASLETKLRKKEADRDSDRRLAA